MKIALATACSVTIGLLSVAPAAAVDSPIPPADHAAIGVLIDHFVKDVVKRQDLAAGWLLADNNLRAGTTRAAWIRGTGVSVPSFPARGADFHNAWTGTLVSPDRAILALMLFPAKGHNGAEQTAMTVDVRRVGSVPAGLFVAAKRRDRRAYRAFIATLGPGDTARG